RRAADRAAHADRPWHRPMGDNLPPRLARSRGRAGGGTRRDRRRGRRPLRLRYRRLRPAPFHHEEAGVRRALATMIVSTLSACATYGNSIGLSELKARHSSPTSRIVRVHGWLTPCGFRSCLMVESRDYGLWLEQAGALERRMDVRGDTSVQFPPPPDRRSGGISFGPSRSFDRQVAKLRHS